MSERARRAPVRSQALHVVDEQLGGSGWMPLDGLPPGGTRGDCADGERPCRYVKCKHHLWRVDGGDRAGPHRADRPLPETTLAPRWLENPMPPSCALDEADSHPGEPVELGIVAQRIDKTRDWTQRIARKAIRKLRRNEAATALLNQFAELGAPSRGGNEG